MTTLMDTHHLHLNARDFAFLFKRRGERVIQEVICITSLERPVHLRGETPPTQKAKDLAGAFGKSKLYGPFERSTANTSLLPL